MNREFYYYVSKMKGQAGQSKTRPEWSELWWTILGSLVGIGLISYLSLSYQVPLLLPSLGASAVLLYGACHVPMAQPRHVVGGHLISGCIGVAVFQLMGNSWLAISLAVTLAIVAMAVTDTMHPPGGATAFIAVYTQQPWTFIVTPVGIGAILLVIVGLVINNLSTKRCYPHYW